MASVPNMRLIPTLSPGPGDGSGEANTAAGFAHLLSTLPAEAGEATILAVQGNAAGQEDAADEAETLSPADAILSLVGLAVPVPPAVPATPAPAASAPGAAASAAASTFAAPASAGPAGKALGSDAAELHPAVIAGLVKATAPAAAPAQAPSADAPGAEPGPGAAPIPSAPPSDTARAAAGDSPILAAQAAGASPDRIGIAPHAARLRPGLVDQPVPVAAGAEPRSGNVVGILRPELASAAPARVSGRRGAEATDAQAPIAAKAGSAETPAGAAVADPVETPALARSQAAATPSVFIPTALAEPVAPPSPQGPAPMADLAAAGEAAIERQLDVAAEGAWLDQLARDIAGSGSEGKLRFRLNPETLGRLQVELTQTEQGASIRLTTETEAARALIADAQPRLMAEARAQGVRIAETHVDLSGGQTGDPRRHDPERRDPPIRTAGQDSHPAETADPRKPSGDRYA